jgi:hypothetical protein
MAGGQNLPTGDTSSSLGFPAAAIATMAANNKYLARHSKLRTGPNATKKAEKLHRQRDEEHELAVSWGLDGCWGWPSMPRPGKEPT